MASASTPASLAETASATLFVALELSRSTWRVALHAPLTNKVHVARGPPRAPDEQGQPAPAGRRGRRRPARADHAQAQPSRGEAGPTCSRRVLLRGRLRRLLATPLAV